MFRFASKGKILIGVTVLFGVCILLYEIVHISQYMHIDTNGIIDSPAIIFPYINTSGRSGNVIRQVCIHPKLQLHSNVLSKFFFDVQSPKCNEEENWVQAKNGILLLSEEATKRNGNITCDYYPILRDGGDFKIKYGTTIKSMQNGTLIPDDHFKVTCSAKNGRLYSNIHAGIRLDKSILKTLANKYPDGSVGASILMIGYDSVSRMTWMRKLPLTYKYFTETLGGRELKGYNIIGDGTPAALQPILTGKTEFELPEAGKLKPSAKHIDEHPLIWKDLKKKGFVTQFAEDAPGIGTFTYRMIGFKNQPVDHYMRPYYLAAENTYKNQKPYCMGSVPRHNLMLNWFKDTFRVYGDIPKFSFGFMSEFSHEDNNLLSFVDKDLRDFLVYMNEHGYLNKTVLILMSDHGARFNHFRKTGQGKLEERMPFFGLRFPEWFHEKFPGAMTNFKTNIDRLTTPFDIHATFHDILNFTGAGRGNISKRGISLFKEVPLERSCAHAGIEPHWCACLNWENVKNNDLCVITSTENAIKHINNLTELYREDCELLRLDKITTSLKYSWNKDTMKFRNFAGDPKTSMDDTVTATEELYQVTFCTVPGNGCFEATVRHYFKTGVFEVNKDEISRINKYGNAPACILNKNRSLRQYCQCKINMKSAGYINTEMPQLAP